MDALAKSIGNALAGMVGDNRRTDCQEIVVPMNCAKLDKRSDRRRSGSGRNVTPTPTYHPNCSRLAVAKTGIVTPASVKQLVAFEAVAGKERFGPVVDQQFTEFDERAPVARR